MRKVELQPVDESALVTTGTPLLSALLDKDLSVLMSCGGKGICSTCHVHVREGMGELSPVGPRERRTLALLADGRPNSRLACQAQVFGDGVVVDVPDGMYIERAEDLLSLLGSHAAQNVLHPVTGAVLIPKGKIVTRTLLEQSRGLEQEVKRLKAGDSGSPADSVVGSRTFMASGFGYRPPTHTTQFGGRSAPDTRRAAAPSTQLPVPAPRPVDPPPARPPSTTNVVVPPPPVVKGAVGPLEVGTQIDKYLLMEEVGRGGAGVVYRALHTKLRTPVAIKFLRAEVLSADPRATQRFAREAQMLAQLAHPNVVRVLDFEDAADRPYVVMEFVDGSSAADLLRQAGRMTPERAVELLVQVSDGLAAAHKLGIVHRDVKPGNILTTRDGAAKLVDLGLAVVARPDADQPAKAGPVEGTIGYMSPEQLRGEPVDHRSDIYSLGATAYHLLAGKLPFGGRSAGEVMMRHLHAPLPPLHEAAPGLPAELGAVVATMMAKAAADRYQTYPEVRRALGKVLAGLRPG